MRIDSCAGAETALNVKVTEVSEVDLVGPREEVGDRVPSVGAETAATCVVQTALNPMRSGMRKSSPNCMIAGS
jgi:hypothetical protein